jgi:hypothetical protein
VAYAIQRAACLSLSVGVAACLLLSEVAIEHHNLSRIGYAGIPGGTGFIPPGFSGVDGWERYQRPPPQPQPVLFQLAYGAGAQVQPGDAA